MSMFNNWEEVYSEAQEKDFKKSGLLIETVRKAGYQSILEQTININSDEQKKIPAHLRIPITNPFTKDVYYHRQRLDKPFYDKLKKKEIRYLTPEGCEPHLYFSLQVDDWKPILSNPSIPLLLTEGEKKADKAIQEGFLAVAVSGVWCWSSNNKPIPDLKLICTNGRIILLAFDSDYKDKEQVQNAIAKLKGVIENYGNIY